MEDGTSDSAMRRLSAKLERQLREDRLEEGDYWYLVSSVWWTHVLGACASDDTDNDSDNDSDDALLRGKSEWQVQNNVLLDLDLSNQTRNVTVLKSMLVEGPDYRLVSEKVWNELADRFGFDWAIARPVVARGPAKTRVVEVYPVTFEILGWCNGLNAPVELLDADHKPLILTASGMCTIKDLQQTIWHVAAASPELSAMFPAINEDNETVVVQVCYRYDEHSPWKPLPSAARKGDCSSTSFQMTLDPANVSETTRVEELPLEPRAYKSGRAKVHQLLVEGRFVAPTGAVDWRQGRFYSDTLALAWRFTLTRGQLVDALDSDNKWYESRVVDLNDSHVKVHYRGWTEKWDEWISRTSSKLAPVHTKVRKWRAFTVGDAVLVGQHVSSKQYPEWRRARVTNVETQADTGLRIELDVDGSMRWMDAQDELLCPVGTHKAVNASTLLPAASMVTSAPNSVYHPTGGQRSRPGIPGVVGLVNLGNTCFLNSMLQCLINTAPLRDYFLSTDPATNHAVFTHEINRDNPLGMGGQMAVEFARLVRQMWSTESRVVAPTKLKSVIGQYAPQFAGYQQQDSHEVMNFLLDGLHEDLNRVRAKPYLTAVERQGRSDSEVAHDAWQQFCRRNDSIIVDLFMGQLRSHVTCSKRECGHESITFDPFMNLSVPLPSCETRCVQVQLFWANGDIPMKYAVQLPSEGCHLSDVKERLSALSGLSAACIIFVEVWNHRIVRTYADTMAIERLHDHVLHAYELERPVTEYAFASPSMRPHTGLRPAGALADDSTKPLCLVELRHQAPVGSPVDGRAPSDLYDTVAEVATGASKQRRVEVELYNLPLLVSVTRHATTAQVHDRVWQVVHRLVAARQDEAQEQGGNEPYRLHVTEVHGDRTYRRNVSRGHEPLLVAKERPFSLTLEWHRHGYQRGYDETAAKRIELHASMESLTISSTSDPLTLLECVVKFTEREQLGEADAWYCPDCKTHVRAFKKFDLFSLPKVLIFHLKRFRYAQNSFYMHRDKIATLVDFPIQGLDLSDFVLGPRHQGAYVYDLYAVSDHMGGLGGGHYTAVAQNPVTKQWVDFNDSHTSVTSPNAAVSSKAYVLFYIRRESSESGK